MRFQCPECNGIVAAEIDDMGSCVQCGHCGAELTVPQTRVSPGSVIGDFVIMHELGRGGMGIVYKAHQISLDRSAAVKILADNYAKDTDFVVGFIKEARAAAKLNHPNIVQAYAVGEDEGIFYFAMENIDGETMKAILKQRQVIPYQEAVGIVLQIAEALEYAWQEEKLVHRDIKPDNIMLTASGRAKLADLGLAKVGDDADTSADSDEVMGTPQYISPEQLTGAPLDCRTDIYSLGATFYQFLTGQFPYDGATAVEISRKHLEGTLIPVHEVNPQVPRNVSLVVEKMMAKDPAMRYQSAGELSEDLALIKRGDNPQAAVSGSPALVQNVAEQAEAENAAAPAPAPASVPKSPRPRLSMPGKKEESAPAQTQAPAPVPVPVPAPVSAPAQAQTSEGGVKKPSLKPAMPKKVTPPPAQPAPAPEQKEAPKEEAEKSKEDKNKGKKKKKSSSAEGGKGGKILLLVILVLVLAVGGFAAFLGIKGKLGAFIECLQKDPANCFSVLEGPKPPPPSEFKVKGTALLEEINNTPSANSNKSLVNRCKAFLLSGLVPAGEEERILEKKLAEFFALADEETVENARLTAISRYEEQQLRKAEQAAEAARKKLLAEEARKDALIRRRAQEALKREAERERMAKRRVADNFKRRMDALEKRLYTDLYAYSVRNDIKGYQKLLEQNLKIAQEAPKEFVHLTRNMVNRTRYMQRMLSPAWEWEKILTNNVDDVRRQNLAIGYDFCTVQEIRNGVIHARTISGKEIKEPVKKLLRSNMFLKFLVNVGYKNKRLGSLPFYFFWRNEPVIAKTAARECSTREQNIYRSFVIDYLRNALKGRYRGQLISRFRNTDEYFVIFPRPKPKPRPRPKPQVRRAAPAKRTVSKAKAAPKKKVVPKKKAAAPKAKAAPKKKVVPKKK